MLGGIHARIGLVQRLVIVTITVAMIFATFAYALPLPNARGALGLTSFEIGSEEPSTGSIDGLVNSQGSPDWGNSPVNTGGTLQEGQVLVINDENNTQNMGVLNPATEANVEANCDSDAEVILNQGQDINTYPLVLEPSGSVPDKVNICQVYVAYEVVGGDTLLYIGVTRLNVTGTVAIAVELNQTSYTDRKVGDLLVTFEFDGGGAASDIRVRYWNGSSWNAPIDVPDDGDSYEHFGEIAVNLSANGLLPSPTSADDCASFSSIAPYGFRGESDSSNVGDWGGSTPVRIPRCGELKITKQADPDTALEFGWTLSSSFPNLTGNISDGETITLDLVNGTYTLDETTIPSPYGLKEIVCNDGNIEPDSISIEVGTSVHCVIYNEASSLIVKKTGEGDSSADFNFSVTGQTNFNLSLGDTSETFIYAPGSEVDISESLPGGNPMWSANGVVCENGAEETVASADGASIEDVVTIAGDTITCTFTNTQDGAITVVKNVINDHGGQLGVGDFALFLDGGSVTSGDTNYVDPGPHTASETEVDSYTASGPVCLDDNTSQNVGHPVDLQPGQFVTCTITNDDVPGTLTLLKSVNNNFGGTAVNTDFTLSFEGDISNGSGVEGSASVTGTAVEAGSYDLDETGPFGYEQVGGWDCGNASMADSDTVTVGLGQDVTCEVTNQDISPMLTLVKMLINDNGGNATLADFILSADGPTPISGVSGTAPVTDADVDTGSYDLSETGPAGYSSDGIWACLGGTQTDDDSIDLGPGEEATCTITNDDVPAVLIVEKEVVNDNGGTAGSGDFQLKVNGVNVNQGSPVPGVVSNVAYTVSEDQISGYTQTDLTCVTTGTTDEVDHPVTLDEGESATCTITNDDVGPTLTLEKEVLPQFGGEADDTDWTLSADGPTPVSGSEGSLAVTGAAVDAGSYDLAESGGPDGWVQSGEWSCNAPQSGDENSTVELALGATVTCVVTNTDLAPSLTLVKQVENNHGGDAVPGDFQLLLNGSATAQGSVDGVLSNTEYTLSEENFAGYTQSGDVVCIDDDTQQDVGHPVSLDEGQSVTCTITNEDIPPGLTLVKDVINDDGGDAVPGDFQLLLNGSAADQGSVADPQSNTEYTLSEEAFPGYNQSGDVVCIDDDTQQDVGHPVSLDEGQSVTCTITNDDLAPGLTVTKVVNNNHGGDAVAADFQLRVNGDAVNQNEALDVEANTEYTVSEDQLDGYDLVGIACEDADGPVDHPVTLAGGQAVLCTVTNEDLPPSLTLVKDVVNDDGGTAEPGDFQLVLNGSAADQGSVAAPQSNTEYTLTEEDLAGYEQVGDVVCLDDDTQEDVGHPVTLDEGQSVTCTITNDDIGSSITVVKEVQGAAAPNDFDLTIIPDGGDAISTMSGETQEVDGNETYTVGESQLDGYVQLSLECEGIDGAVDHPVELGLDQHVTCTIVNAESPTVTVIKTTLPEDSSLFEFNLDGTGFSDSQDVAGNGGSYTWDALEPGEFDLTENTPVDWLLESVECDTDFEDLEDGAGLSVEYGDHVTCVFGNGELGSITVVKQTDLATDELFDISMGEDSQMLGNGDSYTWDLLVPGEYSVMEVLSADQATQWDASVNCDTDYGTALGENSLRAEFDLGYGQHVTCTFTNTAAPSDLAVTKIDLVDPVVVDTDNPTALITYEVTVTNNGPAVAENVVVTDMLPATLTYVSATSEVGSCAHAGGVVTCQLGDMAVGAVVTITIVVETEALGEITESTPLNVVEVSSDTDDNNPSNNTDDEETNIIEVLDVIDILPFTGIDSDTLFMLSLGLGIGGVLLVWMTRKREEEEGLDR